MDNADIEEISFLGFVGWEVRFEHGDISFQSGVWVNRYVLKLSGCVDIRFLC